MVTSPSNTRSIIFDGICTTAMNSVFVGPFLAAFALALGATHWEIGLISAIAFLSMPMQGLLLLSGSVSVSQTLPSGRWDIR